MTLRHLAPFTAADKKIPGKDIRIRGILFLEPRPGTADSLWYFLHSDPVHLRGCEPAGGVAPGFTASWCLGTPSNGASVAAWLRCSLDPFTPVSPLCPKETLCS